MSASDNSPDGVVSFPGAEERARRLRLEVERLARLPTVEWMFYAADASYVARYGVDCATFKRMVEDVVEENKKKQHDEQVERRRIEDRAEKQRTANEREKERKDERRAQREKKDAEKKDRVRQDALAA